MDQRERRVTLIVVLKGESIRLNTRDTHETWIANIAEVSTSYNLFYGWAHLVMVF